MNKLMGFYELRNLNLPSIPWSEYTGKEELDNGILWTVRSAVFQGEDFNLPRLVGVNSKQAAEFANKLLNNLSGKGIVIFYPYFSANKSGTLNVYQDKVVIEAVKEDLWNLVTLSDREVTIQIMDGMEKYNGNGSFLSQKEKDRLLSYLPDLRRVYRDELLEGKGVLLEWSYAQNCSLEKEPKGEEYLVFYEVRTAP